MKSEVFNGSRFWTYFKYDLMQMWRNHVKAAILIGFSGLILYVLGISFNALVDKVWQAPSFSARAVVFMIAGTVPDPHLRLPHQPTQRRCLAHASGLRL